MPAADSAEQPALSTASAEREPELPAANAEHELALLLTDVVDSTQLSERVGDAQAALLWAAHDRAARELLRSWRGREVGRSDGFLLLFERCDDALGFAQGYHRALAALPVPLSARVGLHWGPVALRHNAPADVAAGATPFEIDGLALPTAARISAAAGGGQTLLSAAALATVSAAALHSLVHADHGHWRLKGLASPLKLHELAAPDAPLTPPSDSAKAYRVVLRDGLWVPVAALPGNLGAEADAFVGREAALQALAQAYEDGGRLVTLLGTGGVGKTRLALRYARGWLGNYPGGAWFCDLSAARSLDGVAQAVAQALDVPLGRTDPVQQLAAALAGRGVCLLVLDNFEQVARHAEACLGVWLRSLPQVRFLVTSREVLALHGETLQGLAPLSGPEAQQLFRQRMQAAGLDATLQPADAAALPDLVQMLDCLPLAIELAASRARVMPPADQLQRIGERFWLLAGRGSRHDRQATLRATLDWSWDLLDAVERTALAQLAVFEGGFTLAACEAVLDFSAVQLQSEPQPWVADVLQGLVEKSLVQRLHARRFSLLRSVQDYAAEHRATLAASAADRHSQYFAGLSEVQAIAERCVEIDNLVAACRYASAASPGGHAAGADFADWAVGTLVNAAAAFRRTGPFRAAMELAAPMAAREDLQPRQRAQVERVLGGAAALMGQVEVAAAHYGRGLALARESGQRILAAQILCLLADHDVQRSRYDAARALAHEAMTLAPGDLNVQLMASNALGNLALAQSDFPAAERLYVDALKLATALRDYRWIGGLHGSLGSMAILQYRLDEARPHLQQALEQARDLGDHQWAGNAHCNLGLLLNEVGECEAARNELEQALRLARAIGHRRLEAFSLCNLGLVLKALLLPDDACKLLREAVAVAMALNDTHLEAQFCGYLGEAIANTDRRFEALEYLDRAQALYGPDIEPQSALMLQCHRVTAMLVLGEIAAAHGTLQQARMLASLHVVPQNSEAGRALTVLCRSIGTVNDDRVDACAQDSRP